ncbi:MAG: hypothetical protein PF542_03390 [Nanoarchaeota archaeon]|jgi:tRNA-specific 2-thiouridylase|nr:hypothetical protein [Nanoarchaeota archaeon]
MEKKTQTADRKPQTEGPKKKALVLFSGGLDSRIAAKMIEEQGFEIHLAFVKLPFGGGCCNNLPCIFNFAQTQGFHLHIIDATKADNFLEYVQIVKKPRHGRGTAMNPCKDCKIYIFKKGWEIKEKLGCDIMVTGEVSGQRPMSQKRNTLLFDDEMSGLTGKIVRPLSAKVLPETDYEKEGVVDREKFLSVEGRRREVQMRMADEYKIKYPGPGGGCLLCEEVYSKKLKILYDYVGDRLPNYLEILFLKRGRMFKKDGLLFVGRNEEENIFIKEVAKDLKWNIVFREDIPGPTIVFDQETDTEFAKGLWKAYSGKDLDERAKFSEWCI